MLSCIWTTSNKSERLMYLVGWFIWKLKLSSRPWRCVWVEVKLYIPFSLVLDRNVWSDSSTSHLIPGEDSSMFLFYRWLGKTHSLSGGNDEGKICPPRESGTGGPIRCPVHMLTENSTSNMWIYYFYTALLVRVHFPITYYIIIIIIIIIIILLSSFSLLYLLHELTWFDL